MKRYAGLLVFFLSAWSLQAADVWSPKPAAGPETNVWRRLVVYADQWGRNGTADHSGHESKFRRGANTYVGDAPLETIPHVATDFYDADGDGSTNDGYVAYLEFSESNRLGMADWPTVGVYPGAHNWQFYGGVVWNISDSTFTGSGFTMEQGLNVDVSGKYPESAEDHPLQCQQGSDPSSRVKGYWSMVWKKEDFLNGASNGTVSCGTNSRFVVFYDRYWIGVDTVRFIIKDSGQYYIHDKAFTFSDQDASTAHRFELNPTSVLWAAYNPSGYDIRFETNQTFSINASTFTNIEAVGTYLAKDTPRTGMMHTKWYNFEFDGYVKNNFRPSEHIDMAEVAGAGEVQDFYMSRCEVPFKLWNQIYKYADSVNWATEARYLFNKDGDMGSMQFETNSHANSEPVVNFTIYDMAVWCNALSDKEGLEPVFYADAAHTTIFKYTNIATRANESYVSANFSNPVYMVVADQPLYMKWDADGYRPPTPAEWEQAYTAGNQSSGSADAWIDANSLGQTQPVGTKSTNDLGIYDMVGNVWETTWIHRDVYVPGASNSQMAVGGGFHYPNDPRIAAHSASPYGDHPFTGRYDVGLRLVRRTPGLAAPATGTVPTGDDAYDTASIHKWKFSESYQTAAAVMPPVTTNILNLVSIPEATSNAPFFRRKVNEWTETWIHAFEMSDTEISYEKWLKVYFWAIENGYEFDTDGCMGSMRWWDFPHAATEPVTAIPWHDMVVWCNALSVMEGFDPVYYTDVARSNEYKKAYKFRPIKLDAEEQIFVGTGYSDGYSREPWIFANWANNGFRLPTHAEWEYAARGGIDKHAYQWSSGIDSEYTNYIWEINNAGGTTHPVGLLQTNGYGLYDIQGNVAETTWGSARAVHPDRPYAENINNPKDGRYDGWQYPKNISAPQAEANSVGGSFFWARTRVIALADMSQWMSMNHNASDVGFRVVKCETAAHPVDGKEDLVPLVLLTFDTNTFDNLQGRCSQGNLSRNGQYPENGVVSNAVIKWTADVGGAVLSSPVVVDGAAYVGGDDGFYALDAVTGTQRWKIAIAEGVDSSPCVVDGVVYFGARDKKMYAIYTNGVEKWSVWSYQGESGDQYRKPVYSSVAVAYDTVFVSIAGSKLGVIHGFSTVDGSNTYIGTAFSDVYPQAAVTMNENYFFWGQAADKSVRSGNIGNGRMIGGGNGSGSYCRSSVLVDGGLAYGFFTGGVFSGGDSDHAAYKVSVISNDMSYLYYQFTEKDLLESERLGCLSSPALWSDQLLIGLDSGRVESTLLSDGTVKSNFFTAGGAIRSPLTVSTGSDTIYFGSWDNNIYGLDAATGTKKWEVKTGGNVDSAVCVYDNNLFVRSDDGLLYCLEEATALEIIAAPPIISVPEGGSNDCYIRLSMQPAVTTTVSVVWHSDDSNITVEAGSSLTFTPGNWDVYQAVNLAAAEDDDAVDSDAILRCTATGLSTLDITATEADNDQKILVSTDSVTVPENGTVTFKVKMNATLGLPSTVLVTHDNGDDSIRITSDNSLDFSIENYDVWQTVTLVADDDEDLLHSIATIQCFIEGLAPVYVTATEFDDDAPLDIAILSAGAEIATNILVLFNEPLDSATAGAAGNYTLNLGGTVISASFDTNLPKQVVLTTAPLAERVEYTLTVNGVEDLPNTDILSNAQASFIYYQYHTYLFDFGEDDKTTPGNWNNLTDISTGIHVSDAISSTGAVSGISLEITDDFNDNAGEGVSSSELYPLTASKDNFIVSTNNPAAFKLSGLDTNTFYEMDFYGSRILTKRAATFTVGSTNASLDNAFNSNTVASLLNLIPEPDGTLTVTVDVDTTGDADYGYLGVLELRTPVLPEAPSIETSVSSLSVPEGGTNTFGVRFDLALDSARTVSVAWVSGDLNLTLTGGTNLVFTTTDWMLYQPVTINAATDGDRVNSSAVIRCSSAGLESVDVTATEADSEAYLDYALPWSETFETNAPNAGALGVLDGQHGWTAEGGAIVTNSDAQGGSSQALSISGATASHTFDGAPTNIWITLWAKLLTGEETAEIPTDSTAVFYVNTNDHLVAYSNTTAIVLNTTVSNDWNKFEVSLDYVSKGWNLALNDELIVSNFTFYSTTRTNFIELIIANAASSNAWVDTINVTATQDVLDSDGDNLPDVWEQFYYGGLSPNPGDSASNTAYTVYQAYVAGIDPTDPLAQFVVTDLQSNILLWNGVSGRVYTVYWTSNLLSGFQTLETNVLWTGSIFTDSTHSAEQKGFYKIEVELE